MTEAKSISNEVRKIAADAQAAGTDFTSAIADDVQRFAKDVGKSGSKAGNALQGDIEDLRKDVTRILVTLRKLSGQVSGEAMDAAHGKMDELTADATKAQAIVKKSALNAISETEAAITQHPLASIMISLGIGFLITQMMRR